MTTKILGIAGAGRMGAALLNGWAKARHAGFDVRLIVIEPHLSAGLTPVLKDLGATINPSPQDAGHLDALVLAVKPQVFAEAAAGLAPFVGADTLVVSIMAGVTSDALKSKLGATRVVRAMPNTPGAIGRGVTAYAVDGDSTPGLCDEIEAILSPLGAVERVPAEADIDAVTALSGSGPAYIFLLVEAMAAAGEAEGLDAQTAMRLARLTVTGAGALLDASPELSAEELRKAVTSPGGTTAAALQVLMADDGLHDLMRRTMRAAAHRSKELGA